MSVLSEALEFLGLAAGSAPPEDQHELRMAKTRKEQRELADAMRRLPGRFAGRLPARILEQVRGAAAAGRWERAVDQLVTALHVRAAVVSVEEREDLRAVLEALDLPGERAGSLPVR